MHAIAALREIIDRALGMLEVRAARVGQPQPAGGALEQPIAERSLQARDAATHGRDRHTAFARGSGEAARLHDANEQRDIVEVDV